MNKPGLLKYATFVGPFPDSPSFLPFWRKELTESLAWLAAATDKRERVIAGRRVKEARARVEGANEREGAER